MSSSAPDVKFLKPLYMFISRQLRWQSLLSKHNYTRFDSFSQFPRGELHSVLLVATTPGLPVMAKIPPGEETGLCISLQEWSCWFVIFPKTKKDLTAFHTFVICSPKIIKVQRHSRENDFSEKPQDECATPVRWCPNSKDVSTWKLFFVVPHSLFDENVSIFSNQYLNDIRTKSNETFWWKDTVKRSGSLCSRCCFANKCWLGGFKAYLSEKKWLTFVDDI